jgi:biopolymer transport protein ExbB
VDGLLHFWDGSDGIGRAVALLLLLMSVTAWVVILWKGWVLRRAGQDVNRGVAAFWSAATVDDGLVRLRDIDREQVLLPLVEAAVLQPALDTLDGSGQLDAQLTRRLRDALHRNLSHLQFGQVLLASVGSTAPFVGLFGTVWGIYHALVAIAASGSLSIEKVAGPVGEALIMTAAGIAVAVPAVLGYNIFGQKVAACEAELEGFAQDLLQTTLDRQGAA